MGADLAHLEGRELAHLGRREGAPGRRKAYLAERVGAPLCLQLRVTTTRTLTARD